MIKYNFLKIVLSFLGLFFAAGCGMRQVQHRLFSDHSRAPEIFIEMPKNNLVVANLSPILYEELIGHCSRLGYSVVLNENRAYKLSVQVKSLEPTQKFISPDILLLHSTMRLEILCSLINFNKQEIAKKTLYFTILLSKPQNPIFYSDFEDYVYNRLAQRAAPKIEQFMRPYMLKVAA